MDALRGVCSWVSLAGEHTHRAPQVLNLSSSGKMRRLVLQLVSAARGWGEGV